MKRKIQKYRKTNKNSLRITPKFLHIVLISVEAVLLLIIGGILINDYYLAPLTQRKVLETQKTEIKKLPPEVNRVLSKTDKAVNYRVPILMYHYVEYVQDAKDTFRISMNIVPSVFEQQVKTLKENGYTFITAREMGEILDGKRKAPKNPVMLTFDDGHWDLVTDVLPILKKYNAKATAYIIPGFLGGSDFLSKEQLQTLIDSGYFEIGAHTVHHIGLAGISAIELKKEILDSKTMLEKAYGIKVTTFAYPFGSFDLAAADEVKKAGFTVALSTVPGIEQNQANRYFMYRLRPGGRTGEYLLSWLKQSSFSAYSSAVLTIKK